MSVLIRGMEMPKNCEIIIRIDEKGEVYVYDQYPTKLYKAIPVPPHGRLIDADALSAKIIEIVEQQKYDDFYTQTLSVGEILREVVNDLKGTTLDGYANAPTIIPADKDGET